MAIYQIEWKRGAIKELKKIPPYEISKIIAQVTQLAKDPSPPQSKKLVGITQTFRLRVGHYRVIYQKLDDVLIIEVLRVAHRKDVYKHS